MIKDRGKLKWQSAFFMPEHVKLLKNYFNDTNKQKKPELDEQKYEEIGRTIMESLNYTLPIKLTLWRDGYFEEFKGVVVKLDYLMKYVLFEKDNDLIRIILEDIIAVERI